MPPTRRTVAALALGLALAAFPLGALASHQFGDVPDSNIYHADIDALADSGVTTGCGGGNFCPSAFVTREQMAAFMNRLGALAPGKTPVVNAAELEGITADQFARSDVAVIGHFNCAGATMHPVLSGETYQNNGARLQLTLGTGYFACPVILSDGAEVLALRGSFIDTSATEYGQCELRRQPFLAVDVIMAETAITGILDTPGSITVEDPTITDPIINNASNAYELACYLGGNGTDLQLYAASVEYSVTGMPIP